MKMRRLLVIFLVLSALSGRAAVTWELDQELTRNRLSLTGALTSSDAYQLEVTYHWMLFRYLGFGGSFGFWKCYFDDGRAEGPHWGVDYDTNRPSNLYLRPSIALRSPGLKLGQVILGLYAEPGVLLNVPYEQVCIERTENWPRIEYDYVSTTRGQWLAFDVRLGVLVNVGPCDFSAGYLMSNLDIFSQFRHLSYRGQSFASAYPSKQFMQGAYLTLSYHF